jgi:hypothetical protein
MELTVSTVVGELDWNGKAEIAGATQSVAI